MPIPGGNVLLRRAAVRPFLREAAGLDLELAADATEATAINGGVLVAVLAEAARNEALAGGRRFLKAEDVERAADALAAKAGLSAGRVRELRARIERWTYAGRPTSYQRDAEGAR